MAEKRRFICFGEEHRREGHQFHYFYLTVEENIKHAPCPVCGERVTTVERDGMIVDLPSGRELGTVAQVCDFFKDNDRLPEPGDLSDEDDEGERDDEPRGAFMRSVLPEALPAEQEFHVRNQRIIERKAEIGRNFWEMGGDLLAIKEKELYRSGGYKSFEAYLGSPEVSIDRSTAYDWMGIREDFGKVSDKSDIEGIDWAKLRKIRPLVRESPELVPEWLNKARSLSRSDLNREVEEHTGRPTSASGARGVRARDVEVDLGESEVRLDLDSPRPRLECRTEKRAVSLVLRDRGQAREIAGILGGDGKAEVVEAEPEEPIGESVHHGMSDQLASLRINLDGLDRAVAEAYETGHWDGARRLAEELRKDLDGVLNRIGNKILGD